jgi:putative mRNA 3-end processing factor
MRIRGTRRRRAVDRGFVLSDHADWPGLLAAIEATAADTVLLTHGYTAPLVRWLRDRGKDAQALATRYEGETDREDSADGSEPAARDTADPETANPAASMLSDLGTANSPT